MQSFCLHVNRYHKNIDKCAMVHFFNRILRTALHNSQFLILGYWTFCAQPFPLHILFINLPVVVFFMSLEKWNQVIELINLHQGKQGLLASMYLSILLKYQCFFTFSFLLPFPNNAHSFSTLAIVILTSNSRNNLRVHFPINKVISVSTWGNKHLLQHRKICIRYNVSWVVPINGRILFGNGQG